MIGLDLGRGCSVLSLIYRRHPWRESSVWLPGRSPESERSVDGASSDSEEGSEVTCDSDPDSIDADAQFDLEANRISAEEIDDGRA